MSPIAAEVLDLIDSLATVPAVAQRIGELVNDPRSDARAIAAVMRSDQSLSAKVLKLANSAYYAIPGGVTDVSRAVSFIGFNTLYQLVLSVSVLSTLQGRKVADLDPHELWKHSLGCAAMAELIAKHLGLPNANEFFTAGLLHDIGKVALLQAFPDAFIDAVRVARSKGIDLATAEVECSLPNHALVGGHLAERWRFPMALRVAIAHHHHVQNVARAALPRNLGAFADVTALANTLAKRFGVGDPGDNHVPELDRAVLERLNLTTTRVDGFRDDLNRAIERSKILLELVTEPG